MTERQRLILLAIIEEYILSAEPIGSRTISKKPGLDLSAATIRNEMSDLEEQGFLEKPHTSAGRTPSQSAFRFYVDHMMQPSTFTQGDIAHIYRHFAQKIERVEQLVQYTSNIVSQLTNCMTFVLDREVRDSKFMQMQFVPLSEREAIVLLVSDTGRVHHQRIELPLELPIEAIQNLVNSINVNLRGIDLSKLKYIVKKELYGELARHLDHYDRVSSFLDKMLELPYEERIYTSGVTRLLEQPEFRSNPDKLKSFLDLWEQERSVLDLINTERSGVQVQIGTEHAFGSLDHCTLITASYTALGESVGTIGVIGPMRMNYAEVIGLIDFIASEFLEEAKSFLYRSQRRGI